jgi:hypothetical protein
MTQAGVPQGVAMKITGHDTPSMFERYAISETADSARALDRVAAHEEPASGGTLTVMKRKRRG